MKKLLSFILTLSVIFGLNICVSAKTAENTAFTTIKIPFPENIADNDRWRTMAIYNDSGEAITLSSAYEDYLWATVPTEYKDREIVGIVPEKIDFTDIEDTSDNFDTEWMSRTGIIKGNENGEARPNDNVTRAEAVAMVMRFMGLEGLSAYYADEISAGYTEMPTFDDVQKNDWFYYVVSYAAKCGIVQGDTETTFAPNRSVTREEITVITANALEYAGLRCPGGGADNIVDKDNVSEWAKSAFERIGVCYIYDYSYETENDWENPTAYLNPQKTAARKDIARLLNNIEGICQVYPSEAAAYYGFDKAMPVIDGSTSTYPFTQVVYENLFLNGRTHKQFPLKHSKSHASYERLINGEVDMLFASVYPASDVLALAEDKGVELELIPIAYDAMVFFTNAENPAEGLTQEQITDIYVNNAYDNWSQLGGTDALLYAYCRNNDSGSHAQMEKHFLNGNEIHPEVQKETSYTMSNVLTDVIGAKTDNPTGYALGYSIYYYFHNVDAIYDTSKNLKLLAIDGIKPTDETIADGTYPLSNNTYVVLRKDTPEDSPARKMAEFMLSEAGQQCVESAGYGKLIK